MGKTASASSPSICPSYLRELSLRRVLLLLLGLVEQPIPVSDEEHLTTALDTVFQDQSPEARMQFDRIVDAVADAAAEVREHLRKDRGLRTREPVVLVLGRQLQNIPLESIPALSGGVQPVSRAPSLPFVLARLLQRNAASAAAVAEGAADSGGGGGRTRGRRRRGRSSRTTRVSARSEASPLATGKRIRAQYLLNPSGDLLQTQKRLTPHFSQAEEVCSFHLLTQREQTKNPIPFPLFFLPSSILTALMVSWFVCLFVLCRRGIGQRSSLLGGSRPRNSSRRP